MEGAVQVPGETRFDSPQPLDVAARLFALVRGQEQLGVSLVAHSSAALNQDHFISLIKLSFINC